ncbi:MAG: hypothetical protein M3P95_11345 [Actinomycetota bacterium]|nr:hypothetical protein [Actinomycetota bacterium]
MSRPSRPGQVLVGVFFWLLFAYLWVDLIRDGKATPQSLTVSAGILVGVAVVVALVTLAWVRHNLGIHRRRGARSVRPVQAPRTDADRLGRPVVWRMPGGAAGAASAPHVVIDGVGPAKVYADATAPAHRSENR